MPTLTVPQANRILLQAVLTTNLKHFDYALANGADLNELSERNRPLPQQKLVGTLALHEAIRQTQDKELTADHIAMIERVLAQGINVNVLEEPRNRCTSPLHTAVQSGHLKLVELLLAHGVKLLEPPEERRSLLAWTADNGFEQFMQMLLHKLEGQPRDELRQKDLENAICVAAGSGHLAIVQMLLAQGVSANAQGGFTPPHTALMYAALKGHRGVVELLRSHGADIWVTGYEGENVLHCAALGGLTELAKELLAGGSDPNALGLLGMLPLRSAASGGHDELAQALVTHGATIRPNGDHSILEAAAYGGLNWLVEACLNDGYVADFQDSHGSTPLISAAKTGQLHTMQLLVKRGANINHVAHYEGETALHTAIYNKHDEVARWLIAQGADLNAEYQHPADGGLTPLMNAASNEQPEIVKMLIAAGADVCMRESWENYTALQYAAETGNVEITKMLLAAGADVAPSNDYGWTALICAAICRRNEIVSLLIEAGSDVNAQEQTKATALHIAAMNGNIEMVAMLLVAGADRNIVNKDGQTPLEVAKLNDFEEVVRMLEEQ